MRKLFSLIAMTLFLSILLVVSGCGGGGAQRGLSPSQTQLFSLLPAEANGLFAVNFKKALQMPSFEKMLMEQKEKSMDQSMLLSYNAFVNKTGIDPKKDLDYIAAAVTGQMGFGGTPDAIVLIRANFNKDKLVTLMKEEAAGFTEEDYKGTAIYKFREKTGAEKAVAFIKTDVAAIGNVADVKKVIDLSKGVGKSILTNEKLKDHLNHFRTDAIFSMVIALPDELKNVQDGGMFKFDLSKAEAVIANMDRSGSSWEGEIKLISMNPDGNRQLVSTLNGLKVFGAAAGDEVAEFINAIDLYAEDDSVSLEFSISDELWEKLQKKMKGPKQGMGMGM
jgi:hypothetical protein